MKTTPRYPSAFVFFGLTYAISWLIWIPLALSRLGWGPFHIPEGASNVVRLLGVLGPATAAILLSAFTGGRKAVGALLGRLKIWRVGWGWWAAVALFPPVLLGATALLYNAFGGNPRLATVGQDLAGGFIFQVVVLAIATLGEEIGWRGLALPTLLKDRTALSASLVLGVIWVVWHLPFWALQDTFNQYGLGYWLLNLLSILPMTIYITWIFNHTRGSILLAAAFHLSYNIVNVAVVQVTLLITPYILLIALQWMVAILLLWRYGPETLTRSPQAGQPQFRLESR